ncbi:MAG: shikimate dehydrogenase [Actinomycetota bacterium]
MTVTSHGQPKPHRVAVLGAPISHSLSPILHRVAYRQLGLTDWSYDAHEVATAEQLAEFMGGLDDQWVGLSLTMPLKTAPLNSPVSSWVESVSPVARVTGAVNTLVCRNGRWSADNTDVDGIVRALVVAGALTHPAPRERSPMAVVIGAGATAASAVAGLARLGAEQIAVIARRPAHAQVLVDVAAHSGTSCVVVPWAADQVGPVLAGAQVTVSTVPAAASLAAAALVPSGLRSPDAHQDSTTERVGPALGVLLDVVYHPWPTPLARQWRSAGGTVVNGVEMLIYQAASQVQLMTGRTLTDADVHAMRAAVVA